MTRAGAPHVEDLADGAPVELWTGAGWAQARAQPAGEEYLIRLLLSDGSTLLCFAGAACPVVAPGDERESSAESQGSPLHSPKKSPPNGSQGSPRRSPQKGPLSGSLGSLTGSLGSTTDSLQRSTDSATAPAPGADGAPTPSQKRAAEPSPSATEAVVSTSGPKEDVEPNPGANGAVTPVPTAEDAGTAAPAAPSSPSPRRLDRLRGRSSSNGGGVNRRRLRTAWEPKAAALLKPGDRFAPYPVISAADLRLSAATTDAAYDAGLRLGQKAAHIGASRPGLDSDVCGGVEPGYSPEAIRAFVEGWSASQQGCLVGCSYVMADLQVLLRRAGVNKTLIEPAIHRDALYIDDREAWPPQEGEASRVRGWTRRLRTTHQTVVEIEAVRKKGKVYRITVDGPAPTTVAVNNTMMATAGLQ